MTTTDPAVAALIREVLAEELARLRAGVREERVRIGDDADLAAFARRVLAIADDRAAREALENGEFVFRLDSGAGSAQAGPGPHDTGGGRVRRGREGAAFTASSASAESAHGGAGHTEVIDRGLLSERHVDRLPRGTARVRLGRDVKLTPLARDRLRRRGIAIERGD